MNKPSDIVREMLEGIARTHPRARILGAENVLALAPATDAPRCVALISGGGSGHEPAHAGYVGEGMLSAAVCGEVFTSPSTDAVLHAIRATAGPDGALLIVKNYTGDRLNFGLAAELARAEGIPVRMVIVADDVALPGARQQRRGIAGTVFVHKIAGAAANAGLPLDEVAEIARQVSEHLGTMGVALDGCSLPGADGHGFELGVDEIELGLGIHGERGVEKRTLLPADDLCELMVGKIVDDLGLRRGEKVAVLINGLGATPAMELAVMARATYDVLSQLGIEVERMWCGTFMSALNMPGCSISLLRLQPGMLQYLDAATNAPAWPGPGLVNRETVEAGGAGNVEALARHERADAGVGAHRWVSVLKPALLDAARALLEREPLLTALDSKAGDGDLGASMKRAAEAIQALPDSAYASPARALASLAAALRRAIAGSSGPFYASALTRAARILADKAEPSVEDWAAAFRSTADAIQELGGARVGDRTMLDALVPAIDAFEAALRAGFVPREAWLRAIDAAESGAHKTATLVPRAGRASYIGERALGSEDGGAVAIACLLGALAPHIGRR
ncbi:dihydroxyacetone kinase [Trinickia caryophylli]|nr:dihydroxyacetone kinase [Trinickia caryophylli]